MLIITWILCLKLVRISRLLAPAFIAFFYIKIVVPQDKLVHLPFYLFTLFSQTSNNEHSTFRFSEMEVESNFKCNMVIILMYNNCGIFCCQLLFLYIFMIVKHRFS